MARHVLVLAAGRGTRMKSDLPKVVHPVAGRPMLSWVLDAVDEVSAASVTVVVGHGADFVSEILPAGAGTALQAEQLGTGHAALVGLEAVDWSPGDTVLVVYGDTPLLEGDTLERLAHRRESTGAAAVVLAADAPDPTGYGRVLRRWDGTFDRIVEHRDADEVALAVTEVNSGMYAFEAEFLAGALPALGTANDQGEYYLPDVCNHRPDDVVVEAMPFEEMSGINTHVELAAVGDVLRRRILDRWMLAGVRIDDPASTWVESGVELAAGAHLAPGTHLRGSTRIGPGTRVGPDVWIEDCTVGADCLVWFSVLRGAVLGDGVEVGPYASLRPGSVLADGAKAGTFVETKNTEVGPGSKVPHLSYLGDATLGSGVNVGAGTITCNYDGVDKHRTEIGDGVFIGSDTMLVAPVRLGNRSVTGAGSTITRDVDDGALAVERADQREIPGYGDRLAARKAEKRARREEQEG
ncbi:MAG: bifunctional UDP-N-acetylglucosamine diphosphorylase/glucosamine-1-phosphate N-acetyltransferase GlmU [Acidimicrobiia bacterium]